MELVKSIIILVIGFALLMKGADYFVEGSSSVAKRLYIPSMIIGMTIVAMGTSLPECAVSVTASLAGNNTLAVSNVVGSNIFNLMVVCGACALFAPLTIKKDTLVKEFPLSIICSVLLIALGYVGMKLGHIDGMVFLILFAGYLVWMINSVTVSYTHLNKRCMGTCYGNCYSIWYSGSNCSSGTGACNRKSADPGIKKNEFFIY